MGRVFQPLLFLLARCTRNQLIRQIEFLKAENEMLRRRVPRKNIWLTPDERRRLLTLGEAIGPSVAKIITIVTRFTYFRWRRALRKQAPIFRRGRPKTSPEIQELVLKIARETGWGYTRILGELRKLHMKVSRQTVVNILKAAKLEPGPRRGSGTWDEFLKMHAATLWQCDFFSKRLISRFRIRQAFALAFINVATRRVWVSPCTTKPTAAWVAEQARAFGEYVRQNDLPATLVTRDNDRNYRRAFDAALKERGMEVRPLAICAPNTNAYVERFIQSIQVECLDHFLVFGEKHFDYLVREYVEHYHAERPHQGLGNRLIIGEAPPDSAGEVSCRIRLGGLLKHYYRAAA